MTDFVVAIDVKPSKASLACVFRDNSTPRLVTVPFKAPTQEQHTVSAASRRAEACAQKLENTITEVGVPTMAVMSKLLLTDINRDPSGPRRAGMWWQIAQALDVLGVPIAEMPPMTAQKWLMDYARPGRDGFDQTKKKILDVYRDIARDKTDFAYYTVAQAAAGAFILGWTTPVTPTYSNLKSLRGAAVSLPEGVTVPTTVEQWTELHTAAK